MPRPLPLIFTTGIPSDAIIGTKINVILSPTPPVECLSKENFETPSISKTSPVSTIAFVRFDASSAVIPFKYVAIRKAEI